MKPTPKERYDLIKHCRERWGLTLREIGEIFGISKQRVHGLYSMGEPSEDRRFIGYPFKAGGIKTIWWNGKPKRIIT